MKLVRLWLRACVQLLVFLLQCLDTGRGSTGTDSGDATREVFYEVEDAEGNIVLVPEDRPRL